MLDRREFIGAIGVSGLALSAIAGERIVKAERIRPGDKVGLVNPATAAFDTQTIEIMAEAPSRWALTRNPGDCVEFSVTTMFRNVGHRQSKLGRQSCAVF